MDFLSGDAMLCNAMRYTMRCDARADGLACPGLWLKKAALLYSYPALIYLNQLLYLYLFQVLSVCLYLV